MKLELQEFCERIKTNYLRLKSKMKHIERLLEESKTIDEIMPSVDRYNAYLTNYSNEDLNDLLSKLKEYEIKKISFCDICILEYREYRENKYTVFNDNGSITLNSKEEFDSFISKYDNRFTILIDQNNNTYLNEYAIDFLNSKKTILVLYDMENKTDKHDLCKRRIILDIIRGSNTYERKIINCNLENLLLAIVFIQQEQIKGDALSIIRYDGKDQFICYDKNKIGYDEHEEWRNSWKKRKTGKLLSIVGITDEIKLIEEAVNRAYAPSVQNTALKKGKYGSLSLKGPRIACAKILVEDLIKIWDKRKTITREEYNKWEKETATLIRQVYRDAGINLYTYGNAQKWINMAIKYIFSSDRVDPNWELFKVCYLPIDREIQNNAYKCLKCRKLPMSWSKCDDWDKIVDYEERIEKEIIKNTDYKTRLWWECNTW